MASIELAAAQAWKIAGKDVESCALRATTVAACAVPVGVCGGWCSALRRASICFKVQRSRVSLVFHWCSTGVPRVCSTVVGSGVFHRE